MSKGYLVVQVFTGAQAWPISAAVVTVKSKNHTVIKVGVDQNGKTKKIKLDAPAKNLSLSKQTKSLPYSVYDVTISAPGYDTVEIKNVQIFPDVTALQQIHLTVAFKGKAITKVYDVPTHHLLSKDSERQIEGPDESVAPIVLEDPVIPESITVHLGRPTASARDVTIPFKAYIKNVASSEIYPTWPEEAIRANIYAQLSFALNRVYTEWYRNKGYPFQITNSTAFDQCYVEGRNIFENVSEIVDGIFNQYITKSTQKIPLFAQYCNGTTVTCEGLSQWGTVDLAEQGYTPFEMLQYYYGDQIGLVKGVLVEGIPDSYPGVVLKEGSEGDAVSVIQNQLNRIRKNYPAISLISPVNGVYGKTTKEAVKTFQSIFSLSQTGAVDSATWYKISGIYVGVTKLAELEGSDVPEVEIPSSGYPGYLLKIGSRGKDVKTIQKWLNESRETYSSVPLIDVDGIFGPGTQRAVIAFQQATKLSADGIVGPATWRKLEEVTMKRKKRWFFF